MIKYGKFLPLQILELDKFFKLFSCFTLFKKMKELIFSTKKVKIKYKIKESQTTLKKIEEKNQICTQVSILKYFGRFYSMLEFFNKKQRE